MLISPYKTADVTRLLEWEGHIWRSKWHSNLVIEQIHPSLLYLAKSLLSSVNAFAVMHNCITSVYIVESIMRFGVLISMDIEGFGYTLRPVLPLCVVQNRLSILTVMRIEALNRWSHPTLSVINLAVPIGCWAMSSLDRIGYGNKISYHAMMESHRF